MSCARLRSSAILSLSASRDSIKFLTSIRAAPSDTCSVPTRCSTVSALARNDSTSCYVISSSEYAKLARRVSMSSLTDSIHSGGSGTTAGGSGGDGNTDGGSDGSGDGNTDDGSDGEGYLDLLRDEDGKSDGGGEDDDGKSDDGGVVTPPNLGCSGMLNIRGRYFID
ncbi:hypothetical protein Tco_0114570, partial [Tanacetum coccineum]